MLSSFRTKLLIAFVLLIGAALAVTVTLVVRTTRQSIIDNAERELEVSRNVFSTLLAEDAELRREQVVFLTNDFSFKEAIATNDEDTIISVLANLGERIGADMIILFDQTGGPILSTHPQAITASELQQLQSATPRPVSLFAVADEKPYQLFITPVMAPDLIAWVGMGAAVDQELLNTFKKITTTEITLEYQQAGQSYVLSTVEDPISPQDSVQISEILETHRSTITVILSTSISEKLSPFYPLLRQVVYIGLVTLLLATVAALLMARGISRPISILSKVAQRIAKGDYSGKIAIQEKNEFGQLGLALNNMRQAIEDREKHISYQANHDILTGVPNRYYLGDWIKDQLREEQGCRPFSLAIVHIYNFNQLIDLYGEETCDQLIKRIAQSIQSVLRDEDQIARLDSNQFLVYLANTTTTDLENQCYHILNIAGQNYRVGPIKLNPEARIGAVSFPEHGQRFDELMRRAGIALSSAHRQKTDFFLYQSGEDEAHLRKINITNRLQDAIKTGGFSLFYQPQMDLRSNKVRQAEALVRWRDQELGQVYPDEFIPLAERSGDITGITKWVFNEVVKQLLIWREKAIDIGVSVNLSARDVKNPELIEHIVAQIEYHKLKKTDFVFEVTESAVMVDPDTAINNLRRLQNYGLQVAMDDFGTGFSSLSQLKSLPISELKIDKEFILNISTDKDDQKIVDTTIAMAHHLKLNVIAEGVEDEAALAILKNLKCDIIQGYYLSKPLPAEDLELWLLQAGTPSGQQAGAGR